VSKKLPGCPDLEHLCNEAKALLKAHRAGDLRANETLRCIARLSEIPDDEMRAAAVSLQEAQHAVARDYGFRSWKALKDEVEACAAPTLADLLLRLRSERVRTRMDALRRYAIGVHPDWRSGTPFGWGLAQPAHSVPNSIGPVLGILGEDPNWRIRREAVSALAAYVHLKDPRIQTTLQHALNDSRHAVQHAAARALSERCPGCGAVPELEEYLSP